MYKTKRTLRTAKDSDIREAVEAYKEGVLEEFGFSIPSGSRVRPFVKEDVPNVRMNLNLRGLEASEAQITEVAEQMGLT